MLSPMLRNILGSLCSLDICILALPDFQLHTVEQVLELLLSLQWKDKVITLTEEQVELLICLDIKPGEISRVEAEDKVKINTPELSVSSCPTCDADIVDSVGEHMNREHERTFSHIDFGMNDMKTIFLAFFIKSTKTKIKHLKYGIVVNWHK